MSTAAVASPAIVPFAAQATASRAGASAAAAGRPPRAARPSAIAASGGTATKASHVRPSATALAALIAPMTATIDAGAIRAHARPRRRLSQAGAPPVRGTATHAACRTPRATVAQPNGSSTAEMIAARRR